MLTPCGCAQDSILLAQLIRVLAVVLECARRSLNVPDMVSALLELMWHLRYHDEPGMCQRQCASAAAHFLLYQPCAKQPLHVLHQFCVHADEIQLCWMLGGIELSTRLQS